MSCIKHVHDGKVMCALPLQLRKTFPLKTLHDVRISPFARSTAAAGRSPTSSPAASGAGGRPGDPQQQQQQQVVELRCASHHNVPEHRGQYVLADSEAACFMVSLALQLLRYVDTFDLCVCVCVWGGGGSGKGCEK